MPGKEKAPQMNVSSTYLKSKSELFELRLFPPFLSPCVTHPTFFLSWSKNMAARKCVAGTQSLSDPTNIPQVIIAPRRASHSAFLPRRSLQEHSIDRRVNK
jgi:hypothetical protein